ncbi:MAG: Pyridoxine 5'-phosphate synthase [Alphaproteobacteria bacterium MarineAlpha9_Bin4]|nr:pyridoxine 5'-phosphate synthase [Pelagibacterales bacterium]PPR26133.1 MAG: Pyridoxine 5'-phosphate synthase [Alphaproteobacteria bacterium MarineAlpha9_Bin4]
MKLGVNIDHVATIRNARGGVHPSPLKAALISEKSGADSIVVHLREDRRHIKEEDIRFLINNINIPLQLEIAPTEFMFNFAIANNIKKVCIVPEKRKELTTEGGLDINNNFEFLKENINKLTNNGIEVSLFIDPILSNIKKIKKLDVKSVEIHTGNYANAAESEEKFFLKEIIKIVELANSEQIVVSAGHGLTYEKVKKIINIPGIKELNIGHFIIGEAIFYGLENVIFKMLKLMREKDK